jgi:tetratricopeptide (TPR) repeat protein
MATVASLYDWDWVATEREFRRAIELNPGYATAHLMYGMTCLVPQARFDEGIMEVRRALELDPLSLVVSTYMGAALWLARRHDEAIEQLRRTIELDPGFSEAYRCLAWVYVSKEMLPEAMETISKARELGGDTPIVIADLAFMHARSGQRQRAQEFLEQLTTLSQASYVPGYTFALIHSGLGDFDRAFEWWERCYQERQGWLMLLKVGPALDLLRSDPRLLALQKKVGLA